MGDSSAICWVIGVAALGALCFSVYMVIKNEREKQQELEHARKSYAGLLKRLKLEPNDSEVREKTLRAGRYYARLSREQKVETIFDEVALKNDIDAACAGSVVNRSSPTPPPPPTPVAPAADGKKTVEQRLEELERLKAKDLIHYEEYVERRNQILDDL